MKVKIDTYKYEAIKTLLSNGVTIGEIANIMGVSYCTILRIKKSGSLEDYRCTNNDRVKEYYAERNHSKRTVNKVSTNKQVEHRDTASSFQASRQIELLEQLNETMKSISNKLAFIVEALS